MTNAIPTRFRAFISYSHADKAWGDWLHKSLETYRVPTRLVGTTTTAGEIPRRLAPIFRDREELSSAADLNRKVGRALHDSANLIVICSPRSATSQWVNEEILEFKRLGRADRIFCLIVDGEPNASDLPGLETQECFCPALRFQIDAHGNPSDKHAELIAADARAGKDGKSNAKLKLIAGLLDVGFDALRQREHQRRMRRMGWIAAFGMLGMLAMSVLAGMALHERNEAVLQREQAESLIGFMLGNLRTKLEAVSRLDILDDVADHAMAYFEAQHDAGSIDSRSKRAKAFLLLGRVRLDQGKVDDAKRAFHEALTLCRALNTHAPGDPSISIDLIDAQFWLGKTAWQQGRIDEALKYFQAAVPVVDRLIESHPDNEDGMLRLAWTTTNIGHIFEAKSAANDAMREYTAELAVAQRLLARKPRNRDFQREVAHAHDNIAALMYSNGNLAGAEQHYRAERDVLEQVLLVDHRDHDTEVVLAIAQTFLAQVAEALGHSDSAQASLRQAMSIGEAAATADPGNNDKVGDLASYCRRLAQNLRLSGKPDAAATLVDRAYKLYAQMLQTEPTNVRAQYGLAATRLEQARLAWQMNDAAKTLSRAGDAKRGFSALEHAQNYERDASLGVASVDLLMGKIAASSGNAVAAQQAWQHALDAMRAFGQDSHDPDQLNVQAEVLTRLGRNDDAAALIARLEAMHYANPAYVAWRKTASPSTSSRHDAQRVRKAVE